MQKLAMFLAASGLWLGACAPPCGTPITYRIGNIDSRFGLSRSELLSALRRAEAIWEDAVHIDLFRYQEDGQLIVSLVYDARQMTAQENARRERAIKRASGRAQRVHRRYASATSRYQEAKDTYLTAQASHQARVAAHNRSVDAWNARGGAPPLQLEALRREEAELESSAAVIEESRLAANALAARANRLSVRYNELAGEVNANVTETNTTAGREFNQGHYVRDSRGTRIDVFEYTNSDDLVQVLAHELGHALGLDHNANPDSIMYGLNSSRKSLATVEDTAVLREKCRL